MILKYSCYKRKFFGSQLLLRKEKNFENHFNKLHTLVKGNEFHCNLWFMQLIPNYTLASRKTTIYSKRKQQLKNPSGPTSATLLINEYLRSA